MAVLPLARASAGIGEIHPFGVIDVDAHTRRTILGPQWMTSQPDWIQSIFFLCKQFPIGA